MVPKSVREGMNIDAGTTFAIFGRDDTLILKKVDVPNAKQMFEKVHKWGIKFAKEKGMKEKDVERIIHKGRGIKIG